MRKLVSIFVCIIAIFSFNITASAAPKPAPTSNNKIIVEKSIDNVVADTTFFEITLLKDGKSFANGLVSATSPLVFSNLPDGRYSVLETAKEGYSLVSISPS